MIRDTLAQYSVSRELGGEIEQAVHAFHDDGILVTSDGQVRRGHRNIMAYLTEITKGRLDAAGPNAYIRHYLYPCRFTFDSATSAKTVTYMPAFTERGRGIEVVRRATDDRGRRLMVCALCILVVPDPTSWVNAR